MAKSKAEKAVELLEEQIIGHQNERASLQGQVNELKNYQIEAKKLIAALQQQNSDEINAFYRLLNDIRQVRGQMSDFGEILRPDQKRYEVSLERHYGRMEALLRETITNHERNNELQGASVGYMADGYSRERRF